MALLFNMSDLNELLVNFYTITNLRIAIFDEEFHEILAYPSQLSRYCQIIRSDVNMIDKCKKCDYNAFERCKKTEDLYVYKCHAGLTEAIAPIRFNSITIGYIMFGQVLSSDEQENTWTILYDYLKNFNIDMKSLHKTFIKKKKVSPEVIRSSSEMLKICAIYLYTSQKIKLGENSLAYRIDKYITDNIDKDISVKDICNNFNLKKTHFYKLSNDYYGMGIMEHIKKIRIQQAKEYLTDTNKNISDIASLVGIPDYNYFSKVFKKETNMTPRDFRNLRSINPNDILK